MTTLELVRGYLNNQNVSMNDLDECRLEETGQTLGAVYTGESAVKQALETLAVDNGNEWHGADGLTSDPQEAHPNLRYLGENSEGQGIWYMIY